MYESPAYHDLKINIAHWKTVQEYVDLARTFRSMAYGESLTLSSSRQFGTREEQSVTIMNSLRTDVLKFLAERCEDIAAKLDSGHSPSLDIRAACKV